MRFEIDLDEIDQLAQDLRPWDCAVKHKGASHTVRPWTLADSERFDTVKNNAAGSRAMLCDLLDSSPEDFTDVKVWTDRRVGAALASIYMYREALIRKNFVAAVIPMVKAATGVKLQADAGLS